MEKKVTEVPIQKKSEQKKKVGIYCRVSTATSAQIHSLSFQASYLLRHALNVKGWHVEDIYIDISSGDTIEKRPEFMRMLSDVKNGKITLVITKSVSRFGRNTEEVLISFRAIKEAGAEIYFDEQGLTSRDPNCELYLSLLSASAQNENWNHSENIKWGIRKRAKDGTSHLYNRPCYGYRLNEEGELEIIPNEALIVRKIYSLYIDGMSVIKIKQYLESNNVPSPTGKETWSKHTIETILTNKKYIGTSVLYKTYKSEYPYSKRMVNFGQHDMYEVSEHHIPIIPEELFEMAQKVRADRTNVEKDEIGNTQRKAKKYTAAGLEIVDEDGHYYIKKKE